MYGRASALTALLGGAAVILIALLIAGVAPRAASAEPSALAVPPPGGLTLGLSGTTDPAAVVSAQSFTVETVSVLVTETQTWLVYVPGAPAAVNTLSPDTLRPESIVTIRRAGLLTATADPPAPPGSAPAVSGNGHVFEAPPPGGLVQGVAGTNDPATLAATQGFAVETVALLDVASQRWLVHVPAAPAFASSLRVGMLGAPSIVTLRRAAAPPPPEAPLTPEPLAINGTAEQVMFDSVNEERVAAGLPPLTLDAAMLQVARAHSRDMLERAFFDHVDPDGIDPFDRMRAAGVVFGYAAENIVSGQSGASAHASLMASPPHRVNILGERYRRIAIGAIARPGGGVMVTELFAD